MSVVEVHTMSGEDWTGGCSRNGVSQVMSPPVTKPSRPSAGREDRLSNPATGETTNESVVGCTQRIVGTRDSHPLGHPKWIKGEHLIRSGH